ncbi:MAG TPA: response regulator [Ilumatobacteraceae bacterium]
MTDTILIVDDSLTVRMDLAEAFEAADFTVVACADAAQAWAALATTRVGLIILDLHLPDADGIEVLAELRHRDGTRDIPILMLSSAAEVPDRIRGLQSGADEYIGKPYDTRYVVARAQELLRDNLDAAASVTTVLVIDDSPSFRDVLVTCCEQAGYRVLQAEDGETGLRIAAANRPDCIIVDGVLPGMDGPSVIRHVRLDAALRTTPCLLLTGSDDHGAELHALDSGADAFVRKGEDVDEVIARVGALLRHTNVVTEVTSSLLSSKKVLAVDDSPTYLNELAPTLRDEGYDVVLARSGEEALELLAIQPVDCVLLDVVMPGIGGRETCRQIKAANGVRDTPVIMLTSLDDREALIDALSVGADDYIAKSNDFEVIVARVQAQLRRKQFEDENRRVRDELLTKEIEATEARAAAELAEMRGQLIHELERKNNELESFSYSVSHDLRAPLRSIDGFSQALAEDWSGRLDERADDYLRRIRSAAQRMGSLIDDLLELSRVGRADLKRGPVDLAELASRIVADLVERDPQRSVTVDIEDRLMVEGDRRLLDAVLENLLGNAWKFTAKVDQPQIKLASTTTERGRTYYVRDNGDGFDMKYAKQLFTPFQRLHTEAEFPGTGIGLATVYRIIDRHGGEVWAEAETGKGATFYFTVAGPHAGFRHV